MQHLPLPNGLNRLVTAESDHNTVPDFTNGAGNRVGWGIIINLTESDGDE